MLTNTQHTSLAPQLPFCWECDTPFRVLFFLVLVLFFVMLLFFLSCSLPPNPPFFCASPPFLSKGACRPKSFY
eukprot:NODE_6666_length_496_cov_12.315436_g5880_i0.p1 GENE.NODE_6666_length_496_cov_12.315436_g5880_i0~~NODE_6666_length_496_cov_12.315436_g5880_i0.p1  ORF type:complete len:73 (+),score=3.43 NODE_6666_length_496_cov_12.315436_g5880_i0:101-319(+)